MTARILVPGATEPSAIQELLKSAPLVWVDVRGPDEDDVRIMRDVFRFHPLAIEDTCNQRQRPKVEEYDGHLFLILSPVRLDVREASFRELDIFVGPNYVVTAHPEDEPVVEEAWRRATDMLDTYRDLVTGTLEVYLSAVSNRLHRVVNRLTAYTVAMGALAVITGFYGMNFEQTWPPFGAPWGAAFALSAMAGALAVLVWVFRRAGWL